MLANKHKIRIDTYRTRLINKTDKDLVRELVRTAVVIVVIWRMIDTAAVGFLLTHMLVVYCVFRELDALFGFFESQD